MVPPEQQRLYGAPKSLFQSCSNVRTFWLCASSVLLHLYRLTIPVFLSLLLSSLDTTATGNKCENQNKRTGKNGYLGTYVILQRKEDL